MEKTDLVIVGGGLIGTSLALAASAHQLTSTVIDAADLTATLDPAFDGRASAVASASARMLKAIGLWSRLEGLGGPIHEIRVTDGASPRFLHFDGREKDDEPLGYMFENRHLRQALVEAIRDDRNIRLLAPRRLLSYSVGAGGVAATLDNGTMAHGQLLVAADGRRSRLRDELGIKVARWTYAQAGIVTVVAHERPHGEIAHELFHPEGPFAILPLTGQRSAIVWTVRASDSEALATLPERPFLAELEKRFGTFLGALSIDAPRWTYPLSFHHAERYRADHAVLVGDAAHGIHPIAGQGFNMGLRDVAALTEVLVDAAELGLDPGGPETLERYERWRRPDNTAVCITTDSLNRLFATRNPVITAARRIGLDGVNRMPALKQMFMAEARGATGKLPKLLAGDRIA